jgi:hypothetical protein
MILRHLRNKEYGLYRFRTSRSQRMKRSKAALLDGEEYKALRDVLNTIYLRQQKDNLAP